MAALVATSLAGAGPSVRFDLLYSLLARTGGVSADAVEYHLEVVEDRAGLQVVDDLGLQELLLGFGEGGCIHDRLLWQQDRS